MPILFSFEKGQILLWLIEFQEDKEKFSIYKLIRYTTDSAEAKFGTKGLKSLQKRIKKIADADKLKAS